MILAFLGRDDEMQNELREIIGSLKDGGLLSLDGGMGTQLQAKGLQPGETPEMWNLERPDDVRAVHAAYFAAGADIVYSNTFGANPAKYHGSAPLADVVAAGVGLAKEAAKAAGPRHFAALDLGPTGRLLKPAGDFEFDAAYDAFAEQVRLGAAAGADLVAVETMGDAYELKAAVLAAKENSSLPVIATVALGEDGKLLTGADPECVAAILQGLRVDALGFNCGFGPDKMLPFLRRLAREAMRSDKRELQRLGRRNYAWAELIDPESVELDDMRAEAADRIIKLGEALKDVNTEKLYE